MNKTNQTAQITKDEILEFKETPETIAVLAFLRIMLGDEHGEFKIPQQEYRGMLNFSVGSHIWNLIGAGKLKITKYGGKGRGNASLYTWPRSTLPEINSEDDKGGEHDR